MQPFAEKTVLVLGAATPNNIGQGIARRFAREGARLMLAGRNEKHLRTLADEIGAAYCLCDITQQLQIDSLVQCTIDRFGSVDVGVNSTGWSLLVPFEETTEAQLRKMLDVQFKGPFQFMQALVRVMREGSSIINISSVTASIMFEKHSAYMGTKAGIDHVVRTVANEYGAKGIRVNSISPGLTDSPMAAQLVADADKLRTFTACYPLGRIGTVEEIAAAAVWLAGPDCFLTGQNLQVNGGVTLRRFPTLAELGLG